MDLYATSVPVIFSETAQQYWSLYNIQNKHCYLSIKIFYIEDASFSLNFIKYSLISENPSTVHLKVQFPDCLHV